MAEKKKDIYIEGIGRRKNAIARVRVAKSTKPSFTVNDRPLDEYFPVPELAKVAQEALTLISTRATSSVSVKVSGGGMRAQAEAIRLGTARAALTDTPEKRPELKHAGFLKRDPRKVERKKFGLRKARRAPQWSKR